MVCDRCILAVKQVFDELSLPVQSIELGSVTLAVESLEADVEQQLEVKLEQLGFALVEDKKAIQVERIKAAVVDFIHQQEQVPHASLQEYLSEKLHYDYTYLSNLFSAVHGETLKQYFINQKVERAKELLSYQELSQSEIAYKLGYSSPAHLSSQFKNVVGVTPGEYRKNTQLHPRKGLDKL